MTGSGWTVRPVWSLSSEVDALPVPLEQARDEAVYGGKAVHLATASRAGLPVPAAMALPAALVAAVAAGDRVAAGLVRRARAVLGGGPVAVRSSALGEDSEAASFAGQHLTVLNPGDVVAAVVEVFASAAGPAPSAYRARLGRAPEGAMAVVLQRLLPVDVAGVLFTCDPLTGADELVVEASWSLGEAVVSGLVTPDLYRMSRDGRVREIRLGCKDAAVVPVQGGGTEVVAVGVVEASRACLDGHRLARLAMLAAQVRQVWPGPSDLEWAYADDRLLLLQRRPITTSPLAAGG